MDGVLDGALLLCACKLSCSLLFLPSLSASYSPVSFCCCCLLIFTDFLVTVFLTSLCILETWPSDLNPPGDVIALRSLLFLSHTYGAVLLFITFLIAVETLIRLQRPHAVVLAGTETQTVSWDERHCYLRLVRGHPEKESRILAEDSSYSHVAGFLCCLSVWVVVALTVRREWELEEVWTTACLYSTDSLVSCLPSLFSHMPSAMNPCWSTAFLCLLLLLLAFSSTLQTPPPLGNCDCYWQDGVTAMSAPITFTHPGMSPRVDPEKTKSSCSFSTALWWNSMQMLECHQGNFVFASPDCSPEKRGGQKRQTKSALTFITQEQVGSQNSSQGGWRRWGFPGLEVSVMMLAALSFLTLPFNLSVNILLIRTIDATLEWSFKALLSQTANGKDASPPHSVTQV
ncbi:uncharacterized protein LOC112145428 [Oryzias melastigma]|uniref:uncharacterized protein LOC112145428 n=1 Tax=Oryzias melastigma TaxID=30732 RepID=UPI000CF7CEE3|nr:uncharacterized protein LOC112145428 [Oryzias melastigma]